MFRSLRLASAFAFLAALDLHAQVSDLPDLQATLAESALADPATDIQGTSDSGAQESLSAHAGKVIVMNISAMWCGPCQRDAAAMEGLYQTYRKRGVQMITVLAQDINGRSPVAQGHLQYWVKAHRLSFPVMNDPRSAAQAYLDRTQAFPTTAIIDRTFKIRYLEPGCNGPEIQRQLEQLLAE
jgi:thiol-disulfide isomerase/thioredoxin